jgi:hypothetical protein
MKKILFLGLTVALLLGAMPVFACPGQLCVPIDIKPCSCPNSINFKSHGTIPVAILSTDGFNAPEDVVRETLHFGPTGTEDSLAFCSPSPEDVNGDCLPDLVCHFNTQETGFSVDDDVGILFGSLMDGGTFCGEDSVRIVPMGRGK